MNLRPFQLQALASLRNREIDLLCLAPTGAGKGIILESIARSENERILLLSPLIALGRQQAERFRNHGIEALCSMGESKSGGDSIEDIPQVKTRVWILSPEAAQNPRRNEAIRRWNPTLVAIDECHCVYEWGEDFRPAYGSLPAWIGNQNYSRTLWMSATLPRTARETIEIGLGRPITLQGGFALPEALDFRVERTPWPKRADRLLRHLSRSPHAGIIFSGTRASTERLARLTQAYSRPALRYHAGLSSEERRAIESQIPECENAVIIATSAFGMGMDYRSLQWVLLWQPTSTLLSLAQALGRVGRGGNHGVATLYWDDEDFRILGYLAGRSESRREKLREVREFLESPQGTHRAALSRYFI